MAKSINEIQDEVIEEFELFENWLERYQLLVDYAKELKKNPLPEADKNDRNKIDGCQSIVWFTCELKDGKLMMKGDADAVLVKGIVALLLHVLNDHTPEEIIKADLYFIERIGLREHLSPTRSNGIAAMLKQIKLYALAYQAK
ncbi:MAG: SufE family protein [Paludibacteraceae bacterium]|nr:SufE family protein [Paludibacteraceae bacterium]